MTVRCLDLFSGIGGFVYGLSDRIDEVVAYCERCPRAIRVLEKNMRLKRIAPAPVCKDIRAMTADWFLTNNVRRFRNVDLLTAGFPCVGFSAVGHHRGFQNEETRLFFEMLRVVDLCTPRVIVLENVPNILKTGMSVVASELAVSRSYDLHWCLLAAKDVGGPHCRNRWYCLAVKKKQQRVVLNKFSLPFDLSLNSQQRAKCTPLSSSSSWWSKHKEPERMTCRPLDDELIARHVLLGNAVVPQAVRRAFDYLVSVAGVLYNDIFNDHRMYRPDEAFQIKWPTNGSFLTVKGLLTVRDEKPVPVEKSPPPLPSLILLPESFSTNKPLKPNPEKLITRPMPLARWATPVSKSFYVANCLTKRTADNLHVQLRFERSTPDRLRGCQASPRFVEWMMGYPRDWTRTR